MSRFLPLLIFVVLAGFLGWGLQRDPSRIESPLIDKSAPHIELPVLASGEAFNSETLRGKVWVLNVFASWCVACVSEHPLLVQLAKDRSDIPLVGLNYKDTTTDAVAWLNRFGDPFNFVAEDQSGLTGIDWGVYGVPETFIIDADGLVRYKHIGPLTEQSIATKLLPIIDSLTGAVEVSKR